MADGDWASGLPRSVRSRLDGLGNYVTSVLEEIGLKDKLSRDDVQAIQLAAFVYGLEEFLREGSRAASRATAAFADLGVSGFTVGREYFSGRNEAVMRGETLANALVEVMQGRALPDTVGRPASLRALVISLAQERSRGRRLDRRR